MRHRDLCWLPEGGSPLAYDCGLPGSTGKNGARRNRQPGLVRRGGEIAEGEVGLQGGERLAVQLRIGIDEVVEGIAVLVGRQPEVTAVSEEDAVDVMGSEEIVPL